MNLFKTLQESPFAFLEIVYLVPSNISSDSIPKFTEQQSNIFKFKTAKKEGKNNLLIIRVNRENLEKITEEDFNKTIEQLHGIIKDKIESRIIVNQHLPIDKYSPNPPLPLSIFEKEEKLGSAVMTGVKFSFHKTKEELKFAVIDVSPCITCGGVDIGINLTLAKEMTISANDIIDILKKSEEYCKYFFKLKDA